MEETSWRGRSDFRFCSRFFRNKLDYNNNNNKQKKRFLNQKLEQEKHNSRENKGLSLDPYSNLHHHPHHLYQNQNHGDAEEEEEQDKYNISLTNYQEPPTASFQELFHQNQLLYGRRLDPDHPQQHQPPPEPPPPPPKKRSCFPSSSSSLGPTSEHASLREKMRESYQNPSSSSLRLGGPKNNTAVVGEIVEVQGGHIVRSTGRKDRHSKVCTSKGPRDRRVRLAAHTAIQFYDVQDRLGYDRPSKAVDWLIRKAKAAIDELSELPAWHSTATPSAPSAAFEPEYAQKNLEDENQQHDIHHQADLIIPNVSESSSKRAMAMFGGENERISSFLPPSLDSDVIADTIKSFFPMGETAGEASSSAMQLQNFSTHDLLSRNSNNNNNSQDLRLSLRSFQDPNFLHYHTPPPHTNPSHHSERQARAQGQHVLLSGTPLGFDGWPPPLPEHHQPSSELSRLQRLPPWNSGGDNTVASTAGFLFNSTPPSTAQQLPGGHRNQFFTTSQRGPLQSSNTPSLRAWMDPSAAMAISMVDQHHHPGAFPVYSSSFSGGIGFASGYGEFSGFGIPARIQGDEEEHDGFSDKPSSASSDSRH